MTYQPFFIFGAERSGPWVVSCDHASNTVPKAIAGGDLGIETHEMARHIAFDIGAAGVARALGERLNAPVICSNFSRLVIDPNRGMDDPTLLMKLYDGTIIPANRQADQAELNRRIDLCYRPYHDALASLMAQRDNPLLCSVHSFTPQLKGRPKRPWDIGVLYADDDRLARPFLDVLASEEDLTIGDNEPYQGHLPGDCVDQHALTHGRGNVLLELRNDLIETDADQHIWAQRLAPLLQAAKTQASL